MSDAERDMDEVNSFWMELVRDSNESAANRLKASELRAKAAGVFERSRTTDITERMIRIDISDDLQDKIEKEDI